LILHVDGRVRGGPMTFLRLTLERLDPREIAVQIVSLGGGAGVDDLRAHGIDVEVWPAGRVRDARWTWTTLRRLLARTRGADLVLSNGAKEHLLGGLAAAAVRRPAAWVCHNVWSDAVGYARLVERVPAQAIVVNSRTTLDALPPRLQPRARLIPFGPAPAPIDEGTHRRAEALRAQWGQPSAVVACLGILAPHKGQHWLLEAAPALVRSHPDLKIVLIGDDPRAGAPGVGQPDGEPSYRDRLAALVRAHGLQERVVFLGYTHDVFPPLLAADVIVHPSLVPETFGFALVEAMQAARPIVAADLGAQAELLHPEQNGLLVPAGDAAALAAAVTRLLDDKARARRMGEEGERFVRRYHTADVMAAAMRDLFLDLIARGRR
jgi:glycosyltransferase involved in cell wall biosynthesis